MGWSFPSIRYLLPVQKMDTALLDPICAMSIEMPIVENHPNRLPFEGILTFLDVPSDKSPSGARGHRLIMTKDAATSALPSLLGMAINFSPDWENHNYRQKCGVITSASIVNRAIVVSGYVYGREFPELKIKANGNQLGMSYELEDAHVMDMHQSVWTINKCTFTGAAVLLRDKAAYKSTNFTMK